MTYNVTHRRFSGIFRSLSAAGLAMAIMAADLAGLVPLMPGTGEAQALVGLPWTPVSVAGAARRTAVRRSTIYVNTLPAACRRAVVNGIAVWKCGGTYYQAYGHRYVVVYVR